MIKRVTKVVLPFLMIFLLDSCSAHKMQFGKRTEMHDKKDSAQSLQRIAMIKKLDFSDFKTGVFNDEKIAVNYRLLKPQNVESSKKYPLIVVFHGSGAIGTDNQSQMGILSKMWLLPENRANYPAYVLSPQFPVRSSNYHLDENLGVKVSESNDYLDLLLRSIDSLKVKENIDPERIYVMGFSMGGATTSNAISKRPDLFAAAINISGISQFDNNDKLLEMPIWIVHGSLDTDNFPQSNFKFFDEMKNKGKVFLWEYKDKYHNNILSAALIAEIPKYLFKQNKLVNENK